MIAQINFTELNLEWIDNLKTMTFDDLNEKIKSCHNISDNCLMHVLLKVEELIKGELSSKEITD